MVKLLSVKKDELGLWFFKDEIIKFYEKGSYLVPTFPGISRTEKYSKKDFYFNHKCLTDIYKSGVLEEHVYFVDLKDNERAIIWKDGRFETILSKGLHAIWKGVYDTDVEVFNIDNTKFEHDKLQVILNYIDKDVFFDVFSVAEGYEGLYFFNGKFREKLYPGKYAFWKDSGSVKLFHKDLKEQLLEIPGQDIMTADNVTLRITALISFQIVDSLTTVLNVEDVTSFIYRESQLAMRSIIGTKELDSLLKDKDVVSKELNDTVKDILTNYGIKTVRLGIRDIILPGEMKEILNKVMEAKKKAEATLICKREETAAMRSQANTAKMLENNPTLIKLKELEILETAVKNGSFKFVLGDKSISESVMNLI